MYDNYAIQIETGTNINWNVLPDNILESQKSLLVVIYYRLQLFP